MNGIDFARLEEWMETTQREWLEKEAILWVEKCLKENFHVTLEDSRIVTKFDRKGYQNLVDGLIGKLVELHLEYNKLALEHHRLRGKKGD